MIIVAKSLDLIARKTPSTMHIVITRYALSFDGASINREWLDDRRNIFTNVTIPSMNLQTSKDFTWVILIDESILRTESDFLQKYISSEVNVLFRPGNSPFNHDPHYWKLNFPIIPQGFRILTTRLDSDDWVNPKFIEKVQKVAHRLKKDTAIFFPIGLNIDTLKKELRILFFRNNQFASFLEHPTHYPFQTVHKLDHTDLSLHGNAKMVYRNFFMWGTVVHARNILNASRGIKVPKFIARFLYQPPL